MAQFAQFAKFTAKQGRGDEVVAALRAALAAARLEGGTEVYAIHREEDNADVVWMYEMYTDRDAQLVHSESSATGELRAALGELLHEPASITRGHVEEDFGLPVR